jgi:tRNA (guanine-N7-)-methyltransferase
MSDPRYLQYEINPRTHNQFPLNWQEIFDALFPLGVEIGCGNGEFLVKWAGSKPDWNFIGLELSLASCERSQMRIFREGLKNVKLIRDDARFVLREFFPENCIRHMVMNFPDPWPKDKHKERRIFYGGFDTIVAMVLEEGGVFEIFTDQEWYAKEARKVFGEKSIFRIDPIEKEPRRPVSTKYERKWREERRTIFHFRAVKIKHFQVKRIIEGAEMPHFYIEKNIKSLKIEKLVGYEMKRDRQVFKIKEIFKKKDRNAYLLRTVAVDDDYMQNFFLLAAVHEKGTIIKIDIGFQPYRTPAVKMAVEEVGKLLNS